MRRKLLFPILLAAAIAPFLATDESWTHQLQQWGKVAIEKFQHWATNEETGGPLGAWLGTNGDGTHFINAPVLAAPNGSDSYGSPRSDSSSTNGYSSGNGYSSSNSSSSNYSSGSSSNNGYSSPSYGSTNNSYGSTNNSSTNSSNSYGTSGTSSSSSGYSSKESSASTTGGYGANSNSSSYGSSSPSYSSSTPASNSSSSSFSSSTNSSGTIPGTTLPLMPASTGNETLPNFALPEVMRFDIQPQWILSRWPRVTTVLSETELEGLRVALVTGTNADDLAGTLTYYFDKDHVMQRLTFHGFTGDHRRLVAFTKESFGFKSVPTLSAGLYLLKWNSKVKSAMRINHVAVVRESAPNARLEVLLEINRPRNYYGLSPEFEELLKQDRAAGRW